jgi:2-desacetyl-2-hydroxyethyl bacteriochlorophyllide A dehydrogenase
MKSIVIEKPGTVVIKDVPEPVAGEGEALLRLRYGGICGSDLNTYRGLNAYAAYPRTPGHEFSGEILEIGPNSQGLKKGDVVTGNPYFNCGACYSCRRGLVNCCTTNQTLGVQREGAFSEYFVMPIERLFSGGGLSARVLTLIEPFCISWHGVSRARLRKGERVLVVGAGTIGLLAALSAKIQGADVWMTDISAAKLEKAAEFGIDGTFVNDSPEALDRAVQEVTGGDGFDAAIEAVGLPSTFQNCIDAAAFGGRVVLIGVGKKNLDFNFTLLQKKELNVFGSRNALKQDFLDLISLVKGGGVPGGTPAGVPLERIITNTYAFTDAPAAFAGFDKNQAAMLKVVLEF